MRSIVRGTIVCVLALAGVLEAGVQDDIGYTALKARLGAATPTGSTIGISQIDPPESGDYLPNAADAEFVGKQFVAMSGPSNDSLHATKVGRYGYGLTLSIAPGISLIHNYEANSWLTQTGLITLTGAPPLTETQRVQNHCWIGSTGSASVDADILRRLDLLIERDGVLVVTGVNNGTSSIPNLLAAAYNNVAVGLTSGASSWGPTLVDVSGRVKPDLVVPMSLISWAAPYVTGAGAVLLEAADGMSELSDLDRTDKALLVKALLMAGATKDEFADWRRGFATPTTNGTVPLDYRYGAGELNVDNSHQILTAGRQVPGEAGTTGWYTGSIAAGGENVFFVEIPTGCTAQSFSILTTWNRQIIFLPPADFDYSGTVDAEDTDYFCGCISGPGVAPKRSCDDADFDGDDDVDGVDFGLFQRCLGPVDVSGDTHCTGGVLQAATGTSLANIDLKLYNASGTQLTTTVDQSVSSLDNVEHIYRESLPAGRYAIRVTSNSAADYAVAWRAVLTSP